MELKYLMPYWGSERMSYEVFFEKTAQEGFDGVELPLPIDARLKDQIMKLCDQYNLILVGQHYEATFDHDVNEHLKSFEAHVRNLADYKPLLINSQTGKDVFSVNDNYRILKKSRELETELGIEIVHEIHRGKFSFSPILMEAYIEKFTDLKLCADLSHWLTVSESRLDDYNHQRILKKTFPHCKHIHARIGYEEGPQINDPRAPEWKDLKQCYLNWWQKIIDHNKAANRPFLTITTEFGPAPYMIQQPFTRIDVGNQWEINCYMKHFLQKHLKV